MSRLDHAIAALDVLGTVVQAVPVVGENLKSAVEIVTKTCEMIKKMKENREGYEQLADRAARLLAAVANTIMKASPEKLKGMEGNIARLLITLKEIKSTIDARLQTPTPTGKFGSVKKFIRTKGKDAVRVSEDQEKVKKLREQLDRAIEEFGLTSSMRVELVVEDVRLLSVRLSKRIEELNQETAKRMEEMKTEMLRTALNATLNSLRPVPCACWDEVDVDPCMKSTRVQLLADIMSWAKSPDAPVVFWLNGLAGTGKSTVARTICEHFSRKDILGASFFISRQVAERRHAPNILRTIVYQLARQQPAFSKVIAELLQGSPDLASSESLQKLAAELFFKPARDLPANAGLVIVIDAMDECTEDKRGRPGGELLPLLLRGLLQLSGRIKLLLTSRVEAEIVQMFSLASLGSQHTVMQLHDLDGAVVRSDIRAYLSRSLTDIVTARPHLALMNWPAEEDIDMLVGLADVLFVFAATVVRFVSTPRQNPRERLDIMLRRREGNSASPYHFLDQVYLQVLSASVRSEQHEDEVTLSQKLRTVVGSIIAVRHPLSIAVHAIVLDMEPDDVNLVIGSLSALLLSTSDEVVRIFHPSFPDFIVNPRRCDDPRFIVSLEEHHDGLALSCLALLNRHLRYNIANLENPDVANLEVKDLDGRLSRSIYEGGDDVQPSLPQALFYAAQYWTTHVVSSSATHSERLLDALSRFCNQHLFHWLELLSLIGSLAYSTQSELHAVIRWTEHLTDDDVRVSKVRDLLCDAVLVLLAYAEPIRSRPMHTFHSAYVTMPHCPLLDTLAQANMPEVRHTLVSPRAAHWGPTGPVLQVGSTVRAVALVPNQPLVVASTNSGTVSVWSMDDFEEIAQMPSHKKRVTSLAISSDGGRIVSGSLDRIMRVWDGLTFEEIGLCEHEDGVNSVTFSPDSSLIASGSDDKTVWIWNARSLEKITRLVGHESIVTSVAFFPDGTRIASASWDHTVRLWDAHTYEPLPGLRRSGLFYAVAISPDSTRLALGESTSGTEGILHVFDILTLAEQAQVSISPGATLPWAIAFSPSGDLIASGTASGDIHVYDVINLNNITTIRGHHGQVTSIAFSSDGSEIVSGSEDGTVRIQPVASSEEEPAPILGHDARVTQVVFSPDGSHLVSGSLDKTVRIWDGLTCEELAVLHGHEDVVWTVAYSPDGTLVISGSRDHTVRVWDAVDFQEITVLEGHRGTVNFVTFAPDGALIASRRGTTRDTVWSVAFSPNGTRLVSTSEDTTVRVWDAVNFTQVAELRAHHLNMDSLSATVSIDGKAILTRHRDDGPSWVCSDDNDTIWTAVPYHTAISAHPQPLQPTCYNNGWVEYPTDSSPLRIWLPAERRSAGFEAIAATDSRLVIGGSNGAMTMIALSQ